MIVIRSRKKSAYLDAQSTTDKVVGGIPSDGAHATLREIRHFLNYFTKLVTEEIMNEIKFITVHDEHIWWYDGEMIRFRSDTTNKILTVLMMNTGITTEELATISEVSIGAVNKHFKKLTDKQYIQRKINGEWHVVIYPSK